MFIFGQYQFHVESERACLVNPTGSLIFVRVIELEGSVIVMRFPVFMGKCEKNGKLLTCESRYGFLVFIFSFADDDPIIDKSENSIGEYIKQ